MSCQSLRVPTRAGGQSQAGAKWWPRTDLPVTGGRQMAATHRLAELVATTVNTVLAVALLLAVVTIVGPDALAHLTQSISGAIGNRVGNSKSTEQTGSTCPSCSPSQTAFEKSSKTQLTIGVSLAAPVHSLASLVHLRLVLASSREPSCSRRWPSRPITPWRV